MKNTDSRPANQILDAVDEELLRLHSPNSGSPAQASPASEDCNEKVGERPWSRRILDLPSWSGPQAQPCPSYTPTRQELEQLARYWFWELNDVDFYCYTVNQSGSTELRIARLCDDRLWQLQQVLGKETIDRIGAECKEDYERFVGPEDWQEFRSPTRKRNER
ncbi:MAG: hypothetical protein HY000_18165 [Planctomycetes bacterium]|nr:hypothetical protein [Planctomycetota bacterium]